MRLGRIGFVWIAFVAASTQASADDLSATQPKPARSHAAKTKIVGPAAPKGDGLSGIPFSDPYAPPVGAGKATGGGFPAAAKAAPKDPQGDLSFTYKWHASNDPVDPYNVVTHKAGPDGPGDTFMGGLKLGF
ncbi:MAG TPA: hypothetical protein VJY34_23150 [Roseiarcus sp.]|nr:hypothetical protein [Roseiarcus sp.]